MITNDCTLPPSSATNPATAAIQERIDALSANGGGMLVVPPGEHHVGTLRLRDHVNLHLPTGATLMGIPDPDLYPDTRDERAPYVFRQFFRSLILARGVRNCGITGPGTICGQGNRFEAQLSTEHGKPRPKLVWFDDCENVWLRDVFLTNAAAWCTHISRSKQVRIDGVRIYNVHQLNNDGIDIDSCRDVRISNCDIDSEDDALCFKTLHHEPCENIVVTNCLLRSRCYGLCIGSESLGDFRDIAVSNCVIHDTDRIGIGIDVHDGGRAENLSFSNIVMRNVDLPLFLRAVRDRYRRYSTEQPEKAEPHAETIRNVLFSDFQVQTIPGYVGIMEGLEDKPLENVRLENWQVRFDGTIVPRRFTEDTYLSQGGLRKGPRPEPGEVIEKVTDRSWGKFGWFFWERIKNIYDSELPMGAGFFVAHAQHCSFDRVRLDLREQTERGHIASLLNCEDVDTSGLQTIRDCGCLGVVERSVRPSYPEVKYE